MLVILKSAVHSSTLHAALLSMALALLY
jgi:hypothetical protein